MAEITPQIKRARNKATKTKLISERWLKAEIAKWHTVVLRSFRQSILDGLPVFLLSTAQVQSLELILKKHYFKTAQRFTKAKLANYTKAVSKDDIKRLEAEISNAVFKLIEENNKNSVNSIIKTTENLKQQVYKLASAEVASADDHDIIFGIDNKTLALTATALLRAYLRNREGLIGITETNWVAEGVRSINVNQVNSSLDRIITSEIQALSLNDFESADNHGETAKKVSTYSDSITAKDAGLSAWVIGTNKDKTKISELQTAILKIKQQQKMWVDVGDKRVRATHRAAGGQVRLDTELFTVGQSELLYPGDGSHGADIKELIRCRCFVYYL